MAVSDPKTHLTITLEAPGDSLSELLGVVRVSKHALRAGGILALQEEPGSWRLLAPLDGRIRLAWADKSWHLSPHHAAAVPGFQAMSILSEEGGTLGELCLRGAAANTTFHACQSDGGLFFERGGLAVERMLRVLSGAGARTVPATEASELAYQLLMALWDTERLAPAEGNTLPLVVEAALGILRRDFAFLDGVGELADRLEVSQEYLTRSFCKYIGITPGKYLTQIRVENAKILLRQGGHSIGFVSDACGFTNSNYFARVFHSSVGMTPRDYARLQSVPLDADAVQEDRLYVL